MTSPTASIALIGNPNHLEFQRFRMTLYTLILYYNLTLNSQDSSPALPPIFY